MHPKSVRNPRGSSERKGSVFEAHLTRTERTSRTCRPRRALVRAVHCDFDARVFHGGSTGVGVEAFQSHGSEGISNDPQPTATGDLADKREDPIAAVQTPLVLEDD